MSTLRILAVPLVAVIVCPCVAQAHDIIPRSVSPDGTRALLSEPREAYTPWTPAKVWVVEFPSKRKLSSNLVPTDQQAYAREQPALQSDQSLFDLVSAVARDGGKAAGGAVNYEVRWSKDLRQVTVSGGAHKFSHAVTFHLVGRQFRRVKPADAGR